MPNVPRSTALVAVAATLSLGACSERTPLSPPPAAMLTVVEAPGFVSIDAGRYHTCALSSTGAAECWGAGTTNTGVFPQFGQAVDQAGPYTQVSAGFFHTCALTPSGAVDCWGRNAFGEADDQPGPYTYVSAGDIATCGLTPAGAVDCWGAGSVAADRPGPYTQMTTISGHVCALTPVGAADCWGFNPDGRADDQIGPFTQISAGVAHTCALTPAGAADCWGDNFNGRADDQAGPYTQVSASEAHTCGLTPIGAVDCWGNYAYATDRPGPYMQVSAGNAHNCALTLAGAVDCWGNNDFGQLDAIPGTGQPPTPPSINAPPNLAVNTDPGICAASVNPGTATATGASSVVASRSDRLAIGDPYPNGVTTITWTATGSTGLTASATQTVAVSDNEPPSITSPPDVTVHDDAALGSAVVDPGVATAGDNCPGAVVSGARSDGETLGAPYPVGTTVITWTATDRSGNSAGAAQRVTVTVLGASEHIAQVDASLATIVAENAGTPLGDVAQEALSGVQAAQEQLAQTPPNRQGALEGLKYAVAQLEAAVKEGLLFQSAGTLLMRKLVTAARLLAQEAIAEAEARGGDPEKIAKAKHALAEGDAGRDGGQYKAAAAAYKQAVAKAEQA